MKNNPFEEIFCTKLPIPNASIDAFVVVCALIITSLGFLAGYRLILPAGMGIELPKSSEVQYLQTAHIITVKSENLLIVNDEISSMKALRRDIEAKILREGIFDPNTPILLRIDTSIPLGTVVKICEILKGLGCTNVHLALNKSF
ncbi:MAG: biopolymer transporter ExbD [Puniceicoccales bacterium]|jgi:biopolymer transport protein ExbD|nr:biopolymer transporter ExbD [Puniceicoccales bacterium]